MRTVTTRGVIGAVGAIACALAPLTLVGPAQADPTEWAPALPGTVLPLAQAGTLHGWSQDEPVAGDLTVPESLAGIPVRSISIGGAYALALANDGTVVSWGGDGNVKPALPTRLDPATTTQLVAQGSYAAAAVSTAGTVTTWFAPDQPAQPEWADTSALTNVKSISLGAGGITWGIALRHDGTIGSWGIESNGNISATPTLSDVVQVAACGSTGLALTSNGQVHAWGGTPTIITNAPTTGIAQIGCSLNSAFAVRTDGTFFAWGTTSGANKTPTALTNAVNGPEATSKVTSLTTGFQGIVATGDHGEVWSWGTTQLNAVVPPAIAPTDVAEFAAGGGGVFALTPAVLAVGKPVVAGVAKVDSPLQATDTTFSGGGTVTGQWLRVSGVTSTPIENATTTSYTPSTADVGKTLIYRNTSTKTGSEPVSSDSVPTAPVLSAAPAASAVTVAAPAARFGHAASVTVKVTSTGVVAGNVAVSVDGKAVRTAALSAGTVSVALPATLNAGRHTVTATYAGNAASAAASASAALTVAKATSVTKVKAPKSAKKGKKVKITVTVAASGGTATGPVTVKVGKAKGKGTVKNGKATVTVKLGKKKGKQKITATFGGNGNIGASTGRGSLKVK